MKVKCWFAALAALILIGASGAFAQEMTPPMSDPTYGATGAGIAPDTTKAPAADTSLGGDGSSVTVPIPGGGDVQVEGPQGSPENPALPPTENWSTQQTNPYSAGTAPMGP